MRLEKHLLTTSGFQQRACLLIGTLVISLSLNSSGEQKNILGLFEKNNPASKNSKLPTTLPPDVQQLLIATTSDWYSHRGQLQAFHKPQPDSGWQPTLFTKPIPILLGKNGLAWGRGALLNPGGLQKKERDTKAPAGCFEIGKLYGYAAQPPAGTALNYHQVSQWDAWPDDPANPYYNRHVIINPKRGIPTWFETQKMRHGDFAYEWLLEIRHNSDPPVPGAGSVIFFHIRRGPDRATSGCTTMEKSDLVKIIQWLRPNANPHYILLPQSEYNRLKNHWQLPDISQ